MNDVRMLLVTVPNADVAETVANHLVSGGFAACVNVIPGLTSTYRWKGAVEKDSELLLVIKTVVGRVDEVTAQVCAIHPYEVPEVIVIPIEGGNPAYLDWVRSESIKR